jgi:gliding motility-associated-like protein
LDPKDGKGTYEVKVTTADGCSVTESITVTAISCAIQKGISPGGANSSFDLSTMNVKRLEIFNRYGSEVYSLDNYVDQWHGQTNSGADLPDGTYFYQIHFADNKVTTGWIYINRKQ